MKIKELIEDFEKEYLFGTDRILNIILYDGLLDKMDHDEKMQWNLENIRSYLSIVWYRLKQECPLVSAKLFNKNQDYPVDNKVEKIVYSPYGKDENSFVAIFNTNLKDKYLNSIFCLCIKDDKQNCVGLDKTLNHFPFCTKEELSDLCKAEIFNSDLKSAIRDLTNKIEANFGKELPSIELHSIDFSREKTLDIDINQSQEMHTERIDSSKATRKNRLKNVSSSNKKIAENVIRGNKETAESRLFGWDHIIIDGSDNLPTHLLNILFERKYYYLDKYKTQIDIIENQDIYKCLKILIQRAIDRSVKRASEKHYIASTYYIDENTTSYLLPLYMLQREIPDCVLLFSEENGKYVGKTLLNIEEARIDARVLDKIDDYKWM